MKLRAALCPSCGGKLSLPDGAMNASCAYCGTTVSADKVRLDGTAKQFTIATKIDKVREYTPFGVAAARRSNTTLILIVAIGGLLVSFCVGGSNFSLGIVVGLTTLAFTAIIFLVRNSTLKKIIDADSEMSLKGPSVSVIGFEGTCPYCSTNVTVEGNAPGKTCPACHKRFTVRDSRFHSVDTPVTGRL